MPRKGSAKIVRTFANVFDVGELRWHLVERKLHCFADMELWSNSLELSRLSHLILKRNHGENLELASFELCDDRVYVCEADWLKKAHEKTMDSLEAHILWAYSRVPLSLYNDQHKLPEYIICNEIDSSRLKWQSVPEMICPITCDFDKIYYESLNKNIQLLSAEIITEQQAGEI